jgi:ATP-dependent RNA helicase RhlE
MTVRIAGVFGGVNIKTQQALLSEGTDIIVGTPGRLYDLILNRSLQTQDIKKLVIDEVDIMLDLGFRFQLNNIFELLPEKRQNIMFSATMTDDVQFLIQDNFINPQTITVSVSGTPLDNISQTCYAVPNFHTKLNLLNYLLKDKATFQKVVVFVGSKKYADLIFLELEANFWKELGIIHSNKSQNNRLATIESFNDDQTRILIASDIIARGLDLDDISHVINFDTPKFPENYIHRIGRTGRAKKMGNSILLFTKDEEKNKFTIEKLMGKIINSKKLPDEVVISKKLVLEEQPNIVEKNLHKKSKQPNGPSFHEKKDKNKKQYNLSGGQKIKLKKAKKYKNPITKKFKRK